MGRKDKKTARTVIIVPLVILAALVGWLFVAEIVGFLADGDNFSFWGAVVGGVADYRVWIIFACAAAGCGVVFAVREMRSGRRVLKLNDLENAHWLSNSEIVKSDSMKLTKYSDLSEISDGMPLYVEKKGRDLTIALTAKPIHTMVIGTTGSGKTSGFVDPVIQILCRTKTKPSLVLTDPKGEICNNHAATLKKQGYEVLVIDLADPYRSARWNPFAAVLDKTRQIAQAQKTTLSSEKVLQEKGKYVCDGREYETFEQANAELEKLGKYVYNGKRFSSYKKADTERKVFIQTLCDEIFIDLQDIVYTVCPITSQHEPVWEQGARNFILALAVAMWEDLRDGVCREQQFNMHTLYKNVTTYATGEPDDLRTYLTEDREAFSKAEGLAQTVLTSTDRTLSSYLSQVNNYMIGFADSGIRRLTSGNDVDLDAFDEKPTALFIKIPDEKENRHFLATLFITQLYKVLVDKARKNRVRGETKDAELKRNVYMIMDEFGNMPKFPSIDRIITVGRSRRIFMCPIIQDFNQLENKYGKQIAGTVKSNCNITVYIGTTDMPTAEEISKRCGNTKQRHVSFTDGTEKNGSFSVNTSAEAKPLVYPEELLEWNRPPDKVGNAIVLQFGCPPFKSRYLPVYRAKNIYRPSDGDAGIKAHAELFDEQDSFYDFLSRECWIKSTEQEIAKLEEERDRILAEFGMDGLSFSFPNESDNFVELNPLAEAKQRVLPLIQRVKEQLPDPLDSDLDVAFSNGNASGVIDICMRAMDHADKSHAFWLKADIAKLKNTVELIARTKGD